MFEIRGIKMLKERRKLEDLYVGDFIYYQGEVCIIIEKSITNSSIRVLSQKGCTYLIVNNDIDIEKIWKFEFDLDDNSIISEEKVLLLREYVDKREEYKTKLKFLNYFRKEVQELGSELENYFDKLKV